MPAARSQAYLLRGQGVHLGGLLLVAVAGYALAAPELGPPSDTWLGLEDRVWFWLTFGLAALHQVVVWIGWRLQLGWGTLTRTFGHKDLVVWGALFLPLLLARPLLVFATGMADHGTLALPDWVATSLGIVLAGIALYTLASVQRFFGIPRALGGDHFRLRYRRMPLVRRGAFRWTPNAMYVLAFLGLWAIAFLLRSHVALVGALMQHAAIWAHYGGTEKPDMDLIYGSGEVA